MKAWDLLSLLDSEISPSKTKVHLAVHNGTEDPLDVYRAGEFSKWQARQSRKNFERPFVVALIQLQQQLWLFAGAYSAHGSTTAAGGEYLYRLNERRACEEINGRLVVHFQRPGRQSYLNGERYADQIIVAEIRAEPESLPKFPGFKRVQITKAQLDLIVRKDRGEWKTALSSVAGVYLVTESKGGKFYVGSATGDGGIWQRWLDYSATGHGGNRELKVFLEGDQKRADTFQFSILEIADTHASVTEILERESHWKTVLLTRIHGLNAN